MHKTTRELLQSAYTVEHHHPDFDGYDLNMDDADLRSAMQNWREAGYPDLADLEDKSPTLETCWTCRHDVQCLVPLHSVAAWQTNHCTDDGNPARPSRDYSGPPCPGWKAKE